jgi:hypothetical protein
MKTIFTIALMAVASVAAATPCETLEVAELNLMSKEELTTHYCRAGTLFMQNFKDAGNAALSPGNQTRAMSEASACDAAQSKISRAYSRKYDEKISSSMCKQ